MANHNLMVVEGVDHGPLEAGGLPLDEGAVLVIVVGWEEVNDVVGDLESRSKTRQMRLEMETCTTREEREDAKG